MLNIKKIFIFTFIFLAFVGGYFIFQQNDSTIENKGTELEIKQVENQREVVPMEKPIETKPEKKRPTIPFSIQKTPKPLTILLLGVDKAKNERYGRSDSIMLAVVQPNTKEVMLMSIPRDTYIEIPGHGFHKLNHAFQIGGPELTRKTISNWLGIDINETASIDYANFVKMINLIGGIEIDVDRRMIDDGIILEKGLQKLSGEETLYYVRFRKSKDGSHDSDYKRTERQRQVLAKLSSELLKARSFKDSISLVRSLFKTVNTTLSLPQIITYGHHYSDFSTDNIKTLSMNGYGERRGGLWYEIITEKELDEKKQLIEEFLQTHDE